MQSKLPIAVLCGFLLMALAACGGGGDGARITELEADLVAEQEAREGAEELAADAELKRQEEEAARKEAEAEAQQAEQEAQQAGADAAEAERLRQEEEEARLAAEAERQRLANAAEERRKADATERARTAIAGHTATTAPLGTLAVGAIEYGEPAPVTNPAGPFTTSTGRSGSWSTTSLTAHAEPMRDIIQVYSDVEAPARESFATSDYNPNNAVIDGTGQVVGHVDITNAAHSRVVASGSFPRGSGRDSGPFEPFRLVDRGEYTVAQRESDNADNDPNNDVIPLSANITETPATLGISVGRWR